MRIAKTHSSPTIKETNTILSDFDGTITRINVLDNIYMRFGSPLCQQINQRWVRGEISSIEEMTLCFDTVTAGKREIEDFLSTVEIDSSLHNLLEFTDKYQYEFAIVSDGLQWYIDFILNRHRIYGVQVYANEISFSSTGIRLQFPWYDPQSHLYGVSKSKIIKLYQDKGHRVYFIGDGQSDREALGVADVVFARDSLQEHAKKHNFHSITFSSLDDVVAHLKDWPLQ